MLFRKVFSTISIVLAIVVVFLAYGSVNNRWYRVVTVEGNSMAPTLWYGDLIIVTPPPEEIPLNTIVIMSADGNLVTHRLVGYDENQRPITKGDANDVVDNFNNPNMKIIGICRLRLPALGYPLLFLSQLLKGA